ncbi:hypothetical protein DESUT3_30620 [Desulfuromonas versatilis]|uniref:Uncharacterized protein n=1 Tax=Desulfuromonas versatilis TaxID=2802975 RepID=A0ABM8HSK2_9BACT|nr:hypothetical protein [Desulfuromonas versatilis]BCR05993.1 hypothetical protein DESUT3_30620 [Desulfuromonas versatilis]
MTVEELKTALFALEPEQKKAFILDILPPLANDAMKDPAFLMQLMPVFLGMLKEKGIELQQLVQLAAMFGGKPGGGNP